MLPAPRRGFSLMPLRGVNSDMVLRKIRFARTSLVGSLPSGKLSIEAAHRLVDFLFSGLASLYDISFCKENTLKFRSTLLISTNRKFEIHTKMLELLILCDWHNCPRLLVVFDRCLRNKSLSTPLSLPCGHQRKTPPRRWEHRDGVDLKRNRNSFSYT